MAKLDDWENIMNGAFGRIPTPLQNDGKAQNNTAEDPFADLTAALQKQQDALTEKLNAQRKAMEAMDAVPNLTDVLGNEAVPTVPDFAQAGNQASSTTSGNQAGNAEAQQDLLAALEQDGLLASGTAQTPPEQQQTFDGLADEINEIVLGQADFVASFIRAMRRPFVLGTKAPKARNVIFVGGGEGTGRHFILTPLLNKMAARGLLKTAILTNMDLSLYADSSNEKIFLQDLYAALHGKGEVVVFENYATCHPSFLKTLASLAIEGSAPLSSRYILNKDGYLIDAGSALTPNAIRSIDTQGKYLLFYTKKGKEAVADHFGAGMVAAIGDFCQTEPFTPETLRAIAASSLNQLAAKIGNIPHFALSANESVRDFVAAAASKQTGAKGILTICEQIFKAIGEYQLSIDTPKTDMTIRLSTEDDTLLFTVGDGKAKPLFDLLPATYKGSRDATEAALDALVGLDSVKEYVRALADNLEIQKRRTAAGLKNASLSKHMIFSGNPGTGKTTIARLVAQYLKAIGALEGGQLIEVSRGDLVGRYTGHTAPLTNNVIESALGGVLFIDEAYSLYRGEQDSFGLEAIDTLVKGMEDHRDNLVVVLAGYTNEMNVFLTANSGLASRFSNNIEFPDYSAAELLAITKLQSKGKGYDLAEDCDIPLLAFYGTQQEFHADTAGNGRLARNTLEKAILNQSKRLIAEPEASLTLLTAMDFELEECPLAQDETPATSNPTQDTPVVTE